MNATSIRRRTLLALCAASASAGMPMAFAADTTRFVVGFPAGGFVDSVARIVADGARNALGGNVVIDGKAGAGGQLAVMDVKGSPPDGHTLLVTPAAMITIYPASYRSLRYDPRKDLAPVGVIAQFDLSVVVSVSSPIRTLADLAKWYRDNPGRAGFGTPGSGSGPHFAAYEILKKLNVDTVFAHYRGDPPQIIDIVGGSLPAGIVVTSVAERNKDKVRVLATTGPTRSTAFPDVPTLRESGVDAVIAEWLGVFAPGGTPPAVVDRLNAALNASLANPETRSKLAALGLTPSPSTPAAFAQTIDADTKRWAAIVKASGFAAD